MSQKIFQRFMVVFVLMMVAGGAHADQHEGDNQLINANNLYDVVNQTFEQSLQFQIAKDNAYIAKQVKKQKFFALLPRVSLSHNSREFDRTAEGGVTKGITSDVTTAQISQTILGVGVPSYEYVSARLKEKTAQADLKKAEMDSLRNIVAAYLNLYIGQQNLGFAKINLDFLTKNYDATKRRFQVGDVSATVEKQALARLEAGKAELLQATGNLSASQGAFEIVTGFRHDKPIQDINEKIIIRLLSENYLPKAKQDAVALALQESPEIKKAHYQLEDANSLKKRALLPFLPSANVAIGQSSTEGTAIQGTQEDNFVQFNLQYNFAPGVATAAHKQVSGLKRLAERSLKLTQRQVKDTVTVAWNNFHTAQSLFQARKATLAASELAFEGISVEYRLGRRSQLEFLDGQEDLHNNQKNYTRSIAGFVNSYYHLLAQTSILNIGQFKTSP